MEAVAKQPYFKEIAHYCCELAQAASLNQDEAAARNYVDQALAEYKACTRATMLLGDLDAQHGRLPTAIATWQRIESQNPVYLALVAERLADAYRKTGQAAQGLRVLRTYQQQYPSLDLLNAVFSLTLEEEGPDAAAALIKDELARNPTLLGLDRLLEAQLLAAPAERRTRPRARQGAAGPAHQAPRHVQMRSLRLSREAVLLALPGMREMGDVFAAADRNAGRIRLERFRIRTTDRHETSE